MMRNAMKNHRELISNAWKKVLQPGLEYIKSKFQSRED
jgi:hypothetical protein